MKVTKKYYGILYGLIFTFLTIGHAFTQEMRAINPISTPAKLKRGGEPVAEPVAIDTRTVKSNVDKAFHAWNNGGGLMNTLSDNFYDKTRFGDAMQTNIPKDSKAKVLSTGGIQTIEQKIVVDPDGTKRLVTLGSVIVNSQVEFNDPQKGFVRVPGTNEVIFEMSQKIK